MADTSKLEQQANLLFKNLFSQIIDLLNEEEKGGDEE